MEAPNIKPINIKYFEAEQSKYPQVVQLPIRSVLLAASGGGKAVLIQKHETHHSKKPRRLLHFFINKRSFVWIMNNVC